MRTIAVLVSLLSLVPLYSLALPTLHDNIPAKDGRHLQQPSHAGGATSMDKCSPAHHEKQHVQSGIACADMGGAGFQPLDTIGICMNNEQAKGFKDSGICWVAKDSDSRARKPAVFTGRFKVGMVKTRRSDTIVRGPPADQPIPQAPPRTRKRPLPLIPVQALAADAQPIGTPRPLPLIPGSHVRGPRPKPKVRQY